VSDRAPFGGASTMRQMSRAWP